MKPDRSNYEIWLIDWLDGALDKVQTGQLLSFLDENPDLKEEVESLALTHLSPLNDTSVKINVLVKKASDLPISQVEYLSIAFLEKDLSDNQVEELQENIIANPENKKLFESIQKIKLIPHHNIYKNKKDLKKLTSIEKVIKLSAIGLSAAASIALLILSYIFSPKQLSEKKSGIAQIITANPGKVQPFVVKTLIIKTFKEDKNLKSELMEPSIPGIAKNETSFITEKKVTMTISDMSVLAIDSVGDIIGQAPVYFKTGLNVDPPRSTLIASNNNFTSPLTYDDRNRLSKFIARTFREKLLNNGNIGDDPIKGYELVEAGVDGLNKLLGWNLSLVATNDESGDLKSFYFSSRFLKFNAPVKNVVAPQ
jgi:hypothetical protein